MEYLSEEYLKNRIEQNQKFLVSLLNLHIGDYYPIRKWLGIAYKGKIDEVSHLSIAYNTKYFKKGKKWYKQQTREYQQPDLGYKLNLVLDRIPQLVLLPALLQPAFRLASVLLFSSTTTTYQPTTKDSEMWYGQKCDGVSDNFMVTYSSPTAEVRSYIAFSIDVPSNAIVDSAYLDLYNYYNNYKYTSAQSVYVKRLTRTNWSETAMTWTLYDGVNAWTTPGGDFTTKGQTSIIIPTSYPAWREWTITTIVQDCVTNSIGSVDLMLGRTSGIANFDDNQFYSREYTTDITKRPKLIVTYTVSDFFLFFNN